MPDRLVVYVDAQNAYMGARDAFFAGSSGLRPSDGNFDPVALATLIGSRPPPGATRVLREVRVYVGRPDPARQPRSHAAHMRQCAAWARSGATVIARPLRYPPNFGAPGVRPEEKGIDVQLAIDFVTGAIDGLYDVGVMFSTDTDLRPALEWVADRYNPVPRAEVAAWSSATSNSRLSFKAPYRTWCHYLDLADFRAVRDHAIYGRP